MAASVPSGTWNTVGILHTAAFPAGGAVVDVWASGGVSGTNWAAAGLTLASKTNDVGTNGQITLDAADNVVTGTSLTNITGLLCYDDTLSPKQGFGYHYLGGASSPSGDVTVVWSASGLQLITLS